MWCASGIHLGPIALLNLRYVMLLIYAINDFYECSEKLNPDTFAGDTNLFLSGTNVDDLFSDINC